MSTSHQTLQEYATTLTPDAVIAQAKQFFGSRNPLYAAFIDREGPHWASFRGQGGEEVIVAAHAVDGGSRVTGSSYMFTMQLARFFTTLPALDQRAGAA